MQIGMIIRRYRLANNLTQEKMARCLGVTAPAVNKWEKGKSMPDITLLSPIARLLGITLDTLLSHTLSRSEEDANRLALEAQEKLKKESFESVFAWAKELLQIYPNSSNLTLCLTNILHGHLQMQEADNIKEYMPYFIECYQQVLESEEEEIKSTAADALYYHYMNCGQFDIAEKYLDYFPEEDPERKRKLAGIYRETGRKDKALQMYEELLYSGYQNIQSTINDIYYVAVHENDLQKARQMAEKLELLAKLFEMGEYHEISPYLELAILEQDADSLFDIMNRLRDNVESIFDFTKSSLYSHMTLKQPDTKKKDYQNYFDEMRQALSNSLKEDQCAFVRKDARFDALFGK